MVEVFMDADRGRGAAVEGVVEGLVADLINKDGVERVRACEQLVDMGEPAVRALIRALGSPDEKLRWEAAKVLRMMRDPRAAPALVDALEDPEPGVRWLATRALIGLGRAGLPAILRGVMQCVDNIWMKEGVIHVLHRLARDGVAAEVQPVLEALEGMVPRVEAPLAAFRALRSLEAAPVSGVVGLTRAGCAKAG